MFTAKWDFDLSVPGRASITSVAAPDSIEGAMTTDFTGQFPVVAIDYEDFTMAIKFDTPDRIIVIAEPNGSVANYAEMMAASFEPGSISSDHFRWVITRTGSSKAPVAPAGVAGAGKALPFACVSTVSSLRQCLSLCRCSWRRCCWLRPSLTDQTIAVVAPPSPAAAFRRPRSR